MFVTDWEFIWTGQPQGWAGEGGVWSYQQQTYIKSLHREIYKLMTALGCTNQSNERNNKYKNPFGRRQKYVSGPPIINYYVFRSHNTCNSSSVRFSPSSLATLLRFLNEIFPVQSSSNRRKAFIISSLESFSLCWQWTETSQTHWFELTNWTNLQRQTAPLKKMIHYLWTDSKMPNIRHYEFYLCKRSEELRMWSTLLYGYGKTWVWCYLVRKKSFVWQCVLGVTACFAKLVV